MIRILDKKTADKIAAGEVVDRPLSVVKELVENAVDALSGSITVEIKKGGKEYIRVTDNGSGIACDEVETAFKRHATSKIEKASDLESIETLGFRGEALPSIAAVSRVEIITKKRSEDIGTKVSITGGEVLQKTDMGCENGTTVIVKDLFYNTPARMKFMKSDASESTLIIEFVSQMALAYPNIKIRMINNGTALFSTRGTCRRYDNILTVYGKIIGEDLIPLNAGCSFMEIEGYVSDPGKSRTNKKQQIFFVNGRVIKSKVIENAVASAYSDRLFKGRYPVAYLFIRIDPAKLDVNVHPNKREIKFHDGNKVGEFITDALKDVLLSKEAIPKVTDQNIFKIKTEDEAEKKAREDITENEPIKQDKSDQVDIKSLLSTIKKEQEIEQENQNVKLQEESMIEEYDSSPKQFDFTELEISGALFCTYIMAHDTENFYLIDQHAAHERIFFEKLMAQYRAEEKPIQPIMLPITVEAPFSAKEDEYDWMDVLKNMGYDIDIFGPKTYIIKGIPMFMELNEAESFVNEFIENLSENMDFENRDIVERIITRSCKSAIKAHDHIDAQEIDALIKDLSNCRNPFSCPHGRPTFIKLTKYEIEKMFKRV